MNKINQFLILFFLGTFICNITGTKLCPLDDVSHTVCDEYETCVEVNQTTLHGVCKCKPEYERSPVNQSCILMKIDANKIKNGHPNSDGGAKADAHTGASNMMANNDKNIIIINESASNKTIIVFIILFTILFIGGFIFGVYYGEKKYRLVTRVRIRLSRQQASNYDEVMIGQDDDDPPIA